VNTVFRFHKMLQSSSVAAQLAASQEGLRSMKLVSWLVSKLVVLSEATSLWTEELQITQKN
jgi:hypothetical protein